MIIAAYTLSVALMILLPVALAAWLRRVSQAPWLLFSLGSLTFLLSQVVHLPLNHWLTDLGMLSASPGSDLPLWRIAITLGLTAGLCEELARAAGYAALRKWKPAWLSVQDSLMLGLGHGGIESMIVGGLLTAATLGALLPLRTVDLSSLGLKPEQLAVLRMQIEMLTGSPFNAGLPFLERALAISGHVTFSLMVWKAFIVGRRTLDWLYIPLAILYHAAVDAVAVGFAQTYSQRPLFILLAFAVILAPGWAWAIWQARRYWKPMPRAATLKIGALDASLSGEMAVFWTALRKEIIQLWRTKRFLVVMAVFLLFGMGSPLMAKLLPQMLGAIPGAEMFKDLIPTPTAGDAMTQYIKNLTQFGFLLAVLLGMGAVAGEKEQKVVPMILSKPMPRWAFISSKLGAQILMYLAAFVLSGLGAYFYTIILFGALDPGSFALLNSLLFLWLLTFVGLSLLGSTLAASTVVAGGIGLGLSVLLMLAGGLPMVAALLPGGLLGWVAQLGQAAAGIQPAAQAGGPAAGQLTASAGAAVSAVIVVVMALVLSIGVFEQQEL